MKPRIGLAAPSHLNVDRRSVHAGRFAGNFRGATEGTSDSSRKLFAIPPLVPFHDDRSTTLGFLPELSYTLQASAKRQ